MAKQKKSASAKKQKEHKPKTVGRAFSAKASAVPVAFGMEMTSGTPIITNESGSDGRILVKHREYITDITSSGSTFQVFPFNVNPGIYTTFPWLNYVAQNYESYRFEKLVFKFISSCATSSAGRVAMAIDYDSADAAPINKQQLMAFKSARSVAPWQSMNMICDRQSLHKLQEKFIRNAGLNANQDINLYDVGALYLVLQGVSGGPVGELHVEYWVSLRTPQLTRSTNFQTMTTTTPSSGASLFSGASQTSLGNGLVTAAANTLTYSTPGQYLNNLIFNGTSIGGSSSITGGTAATTSLASIISSGGTTGIQEFISNITAAGQTVSFATVPGTPTLTNSILRVQPYSGA